MSRIPSLDAFRAVAILAVLNLHARLFLTTDLVGRERTVGIVLEHAARFAVPFFFFASGYLLARGRADRPPLDRAAASFRRVVVLFLIWSVILFAVEPVERWLIASLGGTPPPAPAKPTLDRFLHGVRIQLWFLPALATAQLLVGVMARWPTGVGLATAAFLYLIGLAGGTYAPMTGFDLGPVARNGPFFGTLFVYLGYRAADRPPPRAWHGLLLIAVGAALHVGEMKFLEASYSVSPLDPRLNYFAGTTLVGLGVGLIALARPNLGKGTILPKIGTLTFGIYVLHVDVQQVLVAFRPIRDFVGQLALVAASFGLTTLLVLGLRRIPLGRKLLP
jgi:surface polysaccharide O-acyltransferase-like enzyme